MRSRRAWVYVLSVAALLVPAAGIAYLGAVSYRDERGAVSAQNERQRRVALGIAARIDGAIEAALDVALLASQASSHGQASTGTPLARYWFSIGPDQALEFPRASPDGVERSDFDLGTGCARARLEDCLRALSTRQSRIARLHVAQGHEAAASWARALQMYGALAPFDDTGPAALLGLARVHRKLAEPGAAGRALAELERRFPERTFDGVPLRLASATLRAEAGPDRLLAVAEDVLAGKYALDPILRLGVLARLRQRLPKELPPALQQRRSLLDERVASIRNEAKAAAGLAEDVGEIVKTATPAWRGRVATREPLRTLLYRRRPDGGVIGISVDAPMLEAAATFDRSDERGVARGARPLVLAAGASAGPDLRTIVQVPLGTQLPHLSLAVVNPATEPDPLDAVIRERSQRHVVYTSALAIALGLGLLATIRGAVRARELAQLKSDFVSTVSHELKTPLTSIRMFAEMLEQGVAKGDLEKMARYHGVIVQESHRLGLLIANLLDYAQIERGTRRYAPSRQRIVEVARHAVATFETLRDPELGVRNPIHVEVSPEAMRAEINVDREVLVQALLNLVSNAAKYGGEAPIQVSVGAEATTTGISVRDHGAGIPAAEQPRIFREFYRAPEAYRSGVEGTGLGLALVKRHVEALGGTVEVASAVGQGATFTLHLPRAAAEVG
ncbi:MAG: HAMP domain-containing sensor histidine kinase [Kofleriaceae bacterium]